MNSSKLIEVFTNGNIVIPMYLLKNYKDMNLELDEFVFLMYSYHFGDNFIFDPSAFEKDLNMPLTDIMTYVENLTDKGFINVTVVKNDKGYMEDIISLSGFFNKLKNYLVEDAVNDEENNISNSTIFELIEKEFGRTISPFECEIITAWLQSGYSEELIREAVKEAVYNGVNSLKYIDKILYKWNKDGIKTIEGVEKNRQKRNSVIERNKEIDSNIDIDIIDGNWYDDDE